ncbi:aminotransferase class I/II-fold pyridoxal phosphate-dependent enzyme [Corynebacterium gerontici]|uniref:8-amino-7-oxononanoate synthase n=1 Tax=Corynebacterium gerontici TaxID=2079234 RepID=A0A3G6J175_9CORY|nr:aminotransferase class I/II-fold pyridoxal phosphate-dependent enzyme [Corynebacterium gerontici]AZA11553.1 8-amino-7-oxononanoate synthase [Corynebacterium gerontici]
MTERGSLERFARTANAAWRDRDLERQARRFTSTEVHSIIEGRKLWQFATADYAGLGMHPKVIDAAKQALQSYGTSSGGSRLTTGLNLHLEAEAALANYFQSEAAVLFPTGFQTNVSVLQALSTSDMHIISDELNHASIIDGARMSKAHTLVMPHVDYQALDKMLDGLEGQAIVVSDAVFSMTGEAIDLASLRSVCARHDAWLVLDDAHGVASIGGGKGIRGCAAGAYSNEIVVGTASKALGGIGGFVLCSEPVAHLLRNRARSFVFSTANTPASTAAIIAAIEVLESDPRPMAALEANIHAAYEHLPIAAPKIPTAIVPIVVGETQLALQLHQQLLESGFFIPAIRYPTVPEDKAMLRMTLSARHPRDVVISACQTISKLLNSYPRRP